jgi:rRNA maturation RNase YbeY
VADNAKDHNLPFDTELHRVIIHGILHLCGYGDKSEDDAARMRRLEDEALAMR